MENFQLIVEIWLEGQRHPLRRRIQGDWLGKYVGGLPTSLGIPEFPLFPPHCTLSAITLPVTVDKAVTIPYMDE